MDLNCAIRQHHQYLGHWSLPLPLYSSLSNFFFFFYRGESPIITTKAGSPCISGCLITLSCTQVIREVWTFPSGFTHPLSDSVICTEPHLHFGGFEVPLLHWQAQTIVLIVSTERGSLSNKLKGENPFSSFSEWDGSEDTPKLGSNNSSTDSTPEPSCNQGYQT